MIHWINHYPADKYQGNQLQYPLDRDLSSGQHYAPFQQLVPGLRKTVLKHLKLVLVRHLMSPLFTSAYCFCTVPCAIFHASSHRGAFQHKPMVAIKRHNVSMVVFTSVFPAVYGCTKNGTVSAYKGKIWKKKIK